MGYFCEAKVSRARLELITRRGREEAKRKNYERFFLRVGRGAEEGKGHEQVVFNAFDNKTREWNGFMV